MKSVTIESFHTVLFCREWDACVAFYRDVLGFAVADRKRFLLPGGRRVGVPKHHRSGIGTERSGQEQARTAKERACGSTHKTWMTEDARELAYNARASVPNPMRKVPSPAGRRRRIAGRSRLGARREGSHAPFGSDSEPATG